MNTCFRKSHRIELVTACAFSILFVSVSARSAGLEKATTWSGHYMGIAGAASSSVKGAESLYFNPAGLAAGDTIELSTNLSPTFAKFNGPIGGLNFPGPTPFLAQTDSSRKFILPFGVLASYKINDKLGLGIGIYASGGTKAIYEGVTFGNAFPNFAGDVKADLSLVEYALGAGYEVLDGLRFGITYRILRVNASVGTASVGPTGNLTYFNLDGLTATRYNGFKVGMQYGPRDSRWSVGADWRTEVDFTATGTATGTSVATGTGTQTALNVSDAALSNPFPQQFDVGGHWEFMDKEHIFLQYTFTEYHQNKSLDASGGVLLANGNPTGASLQGIGQNWQNMNQIRLGYECDALSTWAFRAGYVFTSQVTPNGDARPTFAGPGPGHTFVLGAGKSLMGNIVSLDGTLEYSFDKGTVQASDLTNGLTSTAIGDYGANDYAAHLGAAIHI